MGIWGRLGNVLKSYLDDIGHDPLRKSTRRSGDPDLDAAYEELDEFLRGGSSSRSDSGGETTEERRRPVPVELRKDFAELGLSPDASAKECKAAYKKLLKAHHPDRHTGNPENVKKATEKSASVNAAYDRIEKWFQSGVSE
jgi:DnaJ-domain-containing protein 1